VTFAIQMETWNTPVEPEFTDVPVRNSPSQASSNMAVGQCSTLYWMWESRRFG
jgi:hypothetical protein